MENMFGSFQYFHKKSQTYYGFCYQGYPELDEALLTLVIIITAIIIMIIIIIIADLKINIRSILSWTKPCSHE